MPYISLDEIIEQTKVDYYLALRATQKNHGTDHEDITPWVNYFLTALTEQTERARKIMDEDQPEKLLSEKQKEIYQLFTEGKEMGVAEVVTLLEGRIERETIKQALSRLVKLKLLERIGQGRGSRYLKL
jgi:Fic family protein